MGKVERLIRDKKMPRKLKIKPYMTVIRPVLLYGAECCCITLRDKVKSVDVRKELGVNSIKESQRNEITLLCNH